MFVFEPQFRDYLDVSKMVIQKRKFFIQKSTKSFMCVEVHNARQNDCRKVVTKKTY